MKVQHKGISSPASHDFDYVKGDTFEEVLQGASYLQIMAFSFGKRAKTTFWMLPSK
ncbi:hypothetical protein PAXRUDRAFT_20139 [Paxillus rubicundulus Ve08.2h10]|uniref:Uncharacterized protein n=1 Tax=Paxillus rubicundulus Ve08.2h10 TaxID=930991 RepID=A0A0D0CFH8_9AGAM|nr:hypothetical protein PAXRUDRAFT_20139 [Paxillus rubicundulus Ve08.2h10]